MLELLAALEAPVVEEAFQLQWTTTEEATGVQFHELPITASDLEAAELKLLGIKDTAKNTFLMGQVLRNDGLVLSNVA